MSTGYMLLKLGLISMSNLTKIQQLDIIIEEFENSTYNLGKFIIDNYSEVESEFTAELFVEGVYDMLDLDDLLEELREEL